MTMLSTIIATLLLPITFVGGLISDVKSIPKMQDEIKILQHVVETQEDEIIKNAIKPVSQPVTKIVTKKLGAAITTIQGTDTLKDSRSTINTNFSNLNTGTVAVGTTSVASITTLSNLTTVGALAAGSLTTGFTAVNPAQGGTGSTTPSLNQVLLGNGTSAIKVVSGQGNNGQFLTSAGAGNPPAWTTGAIDLTLPNTWTPASTTFTRGVQMGYSTTTNATSTTIFSQLGSFTQATTTALGVGVATTTSGNAQIRADVQIGGNLSINGNATIATTTGTATGFVNPVIVTNTGAGPTTGAGQATVLATCSAGYYVVGGGASDTEVNAVFLNQSNPEGKVAWRVRYVAQTGGSPANTMTSYAICVPN